MRNWVLSVSTVKFANSEQGTATVRHETSRLRAQAERSGELVHYSGNRAPTGSTPFVCPTAIEDRNKETYAFSLLGQLNKSIQ